jgi:hypothetical protein
VRCQGLGHQLKLLPVGLPTRDPAEMAGMCQRTP